MEFQIILFRGSNNLDNNFSGFYRLEDRFDEGERWRRGGYLGIFEIPIHSWNVSMGNIFLSVSVRAKVEK